MAILLGTGAIPSTAGGSAPYVRMIKFTAEDSGTIDTIKVYPKTNGGNVKVAIYDDDGGDGEPGTRLGYNNSSTNCIADQWNDCIISEVEVTEGEDYWIAVASENYGGSSYSGTGTKPVRYKAITYASYTFPNPAGSGYTPSDAYYLPYAGWGELAELVITPSTIPSAEAVGTPQLNLSIKPATIESQEAVGSPTITVEGAFIYPATIPSAEAVGVPALLYPQSIAPITIPSAEVVGIPSIGVIGYILPATIPSEEAVGVPTILKYVWHVILDGQYLTGTPETNRAFVIGRDDYGNPVWGQAHDTDESALVGERLDFHQELAIPSSSQAAAAAEAILSKMRLTRARGVILIPPNCGQELFDVVELSDAGANQSAVKFRVVGIRFEYQPRQARYQHKLILGAP